MKPIFEETACPRCGDSDGNTNDEAVQMTMPVTDIAKDRTRVIWCATRVIWCAAGHITVINGRGRVTEVNDWDRDIK